MSIQSDSSGYPRFWNPSFLDHCPRQTMGFPQLFVCLPWVKPPFSPGIIPGPQVQQIVDMSGFAMALKPVTWRKHPQSTGSCQRILNHTINIHQEIIRIQNTLKQTHQNLSDIHQTSMEKSIKTPRFFAQEPRLRPGTTPRMGRWWPSTAAALWSPPGRGVAGRNSHGTSRKEMGGWTDLDGLTMKNGDFTWFNNQNWWFNQKWWLNMR